MLLEYKVLRDLDCFVSIDTIRRGDWIDLCSAIGMILEKGKYYKIPLGFAMELPAGYEAYIAPRSSTFEKYGIIQTNGIGIIDNAYCGNDDEWLMPVYATRDCVINKGDRICQFRIMDKQPPATFKKVENLKSKNRAGFGSTGTSIYEDDLK